MNKLLLLYPFLKNTVTSIPFVQSLRKSEYKKKFSGECYGCFWGVFETFEEAIQAAPITKSIGYNNLELAQDYKDSLPKNIASYDYPVIFWLREIFKESSTIFDFGGNIGIHFFLYEKYLNYPENLKWCVCDVPAITAAGKQIAFENKKDELKFTNNFDDANFNEIFLASGSIQYIESLSISLSKLDNKPKYLLINRLPLYNGKQFVTLQNGGQVFYPQYVFNKKEFINSFLDIDYELIDVWQDRVDRCMIPLHPERLVHFYTGLYFKLKT